MGLDNIDYLKEISNRRIRETSTDMKRYLYNDIDWRDRLIMIKGMRGVGKTTLMLQRIKEEFGLSEKAIYLSLDNLWFADNNVRDVAEFHYLHGGTHLFPDEVHYFKDWQQLIKNLYDDFPKMNIIYSGSVLLKLETANTDPDLSRRQISYTLQGLSFREFLEFEKLGKFQAWDLDYMLKNHADIAGEIADKILPETNILSQFNRYIYNGYYPFYKEVYGGYYDRIEQIINQVLENDYPAVEGISYATIQKTKKMLMILAKNTPQTPNMSILYNELETDRNQGLKMPGILYAAGILRLLSSKSISLKNMSRPEKIYCNDTNIMAALVREPDMGSLRETFFFNQMESAGNTCTYPSKGDFLVNKKFLFEVGGKNKTFAQIKNVNESFLAVDGMEIGYGNRIPLWLFGFLY